MIKELSIQNEDFCVLSSLSSGLSVGVVENINMVSLDSAAPVLSGVHNPIDHYLGAVGDNVRIYGDGMAGSGYGAGAGEPSPSS